MNNLKKILSTKQKKIIRLILKLAFHYTDLVTDLMLVYSIFKISNEEYERTGRTSD